MQASRTALLLFLAASTLAGCLPRRTVGHFDTAAFYHTRRHYRIRYDDGGALLGEQWRVINYDHTADGQPLFAQRTEPYLETHLLNHYTSVRGERSFTLPRVDLRYQHRELPSEIWVRTVPLAQGWGQATIGQVLQGAVAAMTRPALGAPALMPEPLHYEAIEIRDFGPAEVDGRVASFIEMDVVGEAGRERVTLVAMHPGVHMLQVRRWRLPMMVVFGLSTPPSEHDAQRAEFRSLVSRVDIR